MNEKLQEIFMLSYHLGWSVTRINSLSDDERKQAINLLAKLLDIKEGN